MGILFLLAYLSLFLQFEGLYSVNGLTPMQDTVSDILGQVGGMDVWGIFLQYPSMLLLSRVPTVGLSIETIAELTLVVGLLCALWVAITGRNDIFISIGMVVCYLTMYLGGGTFMSFQWDILLLEVGWVFVLSGTHSRCSRLWNSCYRLVLFKLMLMSGVVKLTAGCETWNGLTALSYHFATQCLPTPLAWWAHQIPEEVLRWGVAGTLLIEIPWTLLLVVPSVRIRRIGAALQALLQVSIIITGNYNFFNLLTIALCIPCWTADCGEEEEDGTESCSSSGSGEQVEEESVSVLQALEVHGPVLAFASWMKAARRFVSRSRITVILEWTMVVVYLTVSSCAMFHFPRGWEGGLQLRENLVGLWGPFLRQGARIGYILSIGMAISALLLALLAVYESKGNGLVKWMWTAPLVVMSGVGQLAWMGVVTLPLQQITEFDPGWGDSALERFAASTRTYAFSSGYGLFRRMTGVGERGTVARPEIVLEGRQRGEGGGWKVVHFLHKPTALEGVPTVVAPHQPRLDWQMWFAALGSYHNNAWLVHLVYKLLHNETRAIGPLINEAYFRRDFGPDGPAAMRASLYSYDFTTLQQQQSVPQSQQQWWHRRDPREWLPTVQRTDSSLVEFLEHKRLHPRRAYVSPAQRSVQCASDMATRATQGTDTPKTPRYIHPLCSVHVFADAMRTALPEDICLKLIITLFVLYMFAFRRVIL